MTTKKTATTKANTPDNSPTQVGEIIKDKTEKLKKQSDFINCPKCNRAYKKQDSLDKHLKSCKGTEPGDNGGARPGAGRKPGGENDKTKELRLIKGQMQMQIAGKVNQLVAAQFRMAVGTGRLFQRYEREVTFGRGKNQKTEKRFEVRQVLDDADFMIYLSLPHDENGRAKDESTGTEYFYMVASEGNPVALANMLDRAFGKPKESLDLSEDPDAPLPKHGTGTTAELNKAFMALVKQQIKEGKA